MPDIPPIRPVGESRRGDDPLPGPTTSPGPDHASGLLADPAVRARRLAMLEQPHVRRLAAHVAILRAGGHGYVPDFDPLDGGADARLLFLLEKPGPRTVPPAGSGFVSRNTADPAASACRAFMLQAGIERRDTVIWNIVPWRNVSVR